MDNLEIFLKYKLIILFSIWSISCVAPPSSQPKSTGPDDVEYYKKLALARTDCKKEDIVGVWVCISNARRTNQSGSVTTSVRETLMFRSNGTGLQRARVSSTQNGVETVKNNEAAFQWSYLGNGVWTYGNGVPPAVFGRIAGQELLSSQYSTELGKDIVSILAKHGNVSDMDSYLESRKNKIINVTN